jgi:hypothetical protein
MISTNGHAVQFIFKKKKIKQGLSEQREITPKDFTAEADIGRLLIWDVDLGITDSYTAADSGVSSKIEKVRKTSTQEHYYLCGYKLTLQYRLKH